MIVSMWVFVRVFSMVIVRIVSVVIMVLVVMRWRVVVLVRRVVLVGVVLMAMMVIVGMVLTNAVLRVLVRSCYAQQNEHDPHDALPKACDSSPTLDTIRK